MRNLSTPPCSLAKLRWATTSAAFALVMSAGGADARPPVQPAPRHAIAATATPAVASAKPKTTPTRQTRRTALRATLVLKVTNPTKARQAILAIVKAAAGHPSLITDHRLHVRIPPQRLGQLMTDLTKQGFVMDKQLSRQDLTEEIARVRGRLRNKSKILSQLRGFLDDSGVSATLQIERTMTRLVREIEQQKGALRVALDRSAMADVRIAFQFRNPTQLRYVRSPFAWIDSVDVQRFLRGF
jgi:hypothetical protein